VPLSTPIQRRKAGAVREVIFEAVARALSSKGVDFTVQDVADQADVSYATIYRYFPSRDDLLGRFVDWLEKTVDHRPIETADDIAPVLQHNYRQLEAHADTIAPVIKVAVATGLYNEHSVDRSRQITSALTDEVKHLEPDVGQAVAWTIRQLGSYQTWMRLREEAGISGECSGAAVAWAVETLLDALRGGQGPLACGEAAEP
jgi:AcrR family transcriptional regulator